MLSRVGMPAWKVGSGEASNPLILEAMLTTKSPLLLSSGMSSWAELDERVSLLKQHSSGAAVFQCTSKYPTSLKDVGLNVIEEMKHRFKIPIGLSDHSGSTSPGIAAIAHGADLLEFHVVFEKRMFGPDTPSSLNFRQLEEVVRFRNDYLELKNNPVNKDMVASEMAPMKDLFNKSLVLNRAMKKVRFCLGSTLRPRSLGLESPCSS